MKLDESLMIKRYKITRTPLREILLRLQNEGLVNIVPRMGTTVAPLDLSGLRQIVELRKNLEAFAVELAAWRRRDSHLKTLVPIADKYREASNRETVYEAAGNKELASCARRMGILMLRYWYNSGLVEGTLSSNLDSIEKIFKGIEMQDANSAQQAMKAHIEGFIDKLKDLIR